MTKEKITFEDDLTQQVDGFARIARNFWTFASSTGNVAPNLALDPTK